MAIKHISVILTFLFTFWPQISLAHVLDSDGDIGAVVHIDPLDDPIVDKYSTFYFDVKDTSGKFKEKDCTCVLTIKNSQGEIVVDAIESYSDELESIVFSAIFPKRDIFTVEFSGAPKAEAMFQPFTLTYDIRVAREASESTNTSSFQLHTIHLAIVILAVAGVFGWNAYQTKRLRKRENPVISKVRDKEQHE